MARGEDSLAIQDAFLKIKKDMNRMNIELLTMKQEHRKLLEENIQLKQELGVSTNKELIQQVIAETLKTVPKTSKNNESIIKKFNKKRRSLVQARISNLTSSGNITLPELKEIVVDNESLCSKATFYRYIEKMRDQKLINTVKINEIEVLINNTLHQN